MPLAQAELEPAAAERRIREQYGVSTLDGFGQFTRAEIAAAEPFRAGAPLALVGAPALTSLYAHALAARGGGGDPPLILDGSDMALVGLAAARAALTKVPA